MPHSLDEVNIFVNPEEDYWKRLLPDISKNEGWTFQLEDFEIWKSTFAGFWYHVAVEKATDKPVACVFLALDEASEVGDEPLYSVGFYYTDPEWRGSGVGTVLFSKIMEIPGEHNATLNGVLKMAPRYASKFGFDKKLPFLHTFAKVYLKDVTPPIQPKGLVAKELKDVEWDEVVAYDKTVCPRKRSKFLKKFIEPSEKVFTRVIVNSEEKVIGFGSFRVEIGGSLCVGPLYADNKEAARLIFDSILSSIDKEKYPSLGLLHPSSNTEAERLMTELSGGHVEAAPFTQSQFTKYIIPVANEKVFAMSECAASFV